MAYYDNEYKGLAHDFELQVKCKVAVESTLARAELLFGSKDFIAKNGWKLETDCAPLETVIYSKKDGEGKLFALRVELPCQSEIYFNDFWQKFPEIQKWNPAISFAKILVKMADDRDITYYGNRDMIAVKARDFVVARGYKKLKNGAYLTVGKSVVVPQIPEKKEYVRGEILFGAGLFAPKDGNSNVTVVDYLMAIDLKGLLPKLLVNTFMSKLMLNDVECNRKHAAELAKTIV